MSVKSDKGKKWALNVFITLLILAAVNIFYVLGGSADQKERHIGMLAGTVGWMIIACPIAFAIGYFTGKAE